MKTWVLVVRLTSSEYPLGTGVVPIGEIAEGVQEWLDQSRADCVSNLLYKTKAEARVVGVMESDDRS